MFVRFLAVRPSLALTVKAASSVIARQERTLFSVVTKDWPGFKEDFDHSGIPTSKLFFYRKDLAEKRLEALERKAKPLMKDLEQKTKEVAELKRRLFIMKIEKDLVFDSIEEAWKESKGSWDDSDDAKKRLERMKEIGATIDSALEPPKE